MNLLCLYGPPASGKLTIAEELAEITGYRLFHNHLSQDLAGEIYPEFGPVRFGLADRLRLDVFEYAAHTNTDIIFTLVYTDHDEDKKFIKNTIDIVTESGGQVLFVELSAPHDVLMERVGNESRKRFHKLLDQDTLKQKLEDKSYVASIALSDVLKLDSSVESPKKLARKIKDHFNL